MGCEYQGWVGQGRELFKGEEKSEEEARESYNVRDISPGGKFPYQNCPALRSANLETILIYQNPGRPSQEWHQPCTNSLYGCWLAQRSYKMCPIIFLEFGFVFSVTRRSRSDVRQ